MKTYQVPGTVRATFFVRANGRDEAISAAKKGDFGSLSLSEAKDAFVIERKRAALRNR